MHSNDKQNSQASRTQAEQVEADRLRAQHAQQLQDNPLLEEILKGIRESVLTELENSGINTDESIKIRLFDYYQSTGLVQKQIKAMIDRGKFHEENMQNIYQLNKQNP